MEYGLWELDMLPQVRKQGWDKLANTNAFEWKFEQKHDPEGSVLQSNILVYGQSMEPLFEYSQYSSLPGLFLSNLLKDPGKVAVVGDGINLSFGELANVSLHVARWMQVQGCRPEDCVGLFVEPSLEQIIGLWGILFAGASYLPLPPDVPQERLQFMVQDAGIQIIFTQNKLKDKLASFKSEKNIKIITLEDVCAFANSEANMTPVPLTTLSPENLAYIVYTSGSTGNPKGVLIEHRSVVNQMQWLVDAQYLGPDKTIIHKTPIGFDAAQWEMLSVCCGSRLIISTFGADKDLAKLLNEIVVHKVTLLQCVPTLLQAAVKQPKFSHCVSLTHILCGAESLTRKLVIKCLEILPGCLIVNLYGPAECTCNASFYEVVPSILGHSEIIGIPIGRPVSNVEFHLLDESGASTPEGEIGELYVSGVQVSRGYLNNNKLTIEKFIKYNNGTHLECHLLYRTGDLAFLDNDGYYNFCGRTDTQVKIKGMRVELEEIKVVLESSQFVESAAVIKHDIEGRQSYLVACVQLSYSGSELEKTAGHIELAYFLRKELEGRLPDYMMPSVFITSKFIPLTVSGKIDMREIKNLVNEYNAKGVIQPRSKTERSVSNIWVSVLDISPPSIYDNFFSIGGDSMNAVEIILSINNKFFIELPLHSIINSPTIESMSKIIDDGASKIASRVVSLQGRGSEKPIFCWPGLGGYPFNLRLLAQRLGSKRPFYGIQAYGINEGEHPYKSINDMITADVLEIKRIQEHGPYTFWGYSFGTTLAVEATSQLEKAGVEVENLVLIAPGMPKGIELKDLTDSFENKELVALLYSVFSRNKDDAGARDCLLSTQDENSFAEFICKRFALSSPTLVKRIAKVITESFFASRRWHNTLPTSISAPTLILTALNDEISICEGDAIKFTRKTKMANLDITHFAILEEPGLNDLLLALRRLC